jgi:hypothetical protein
MGEVRVYVEGGGDDDATRRRCREGFGALIAKLIPKGSRPKVIACGTRRVAFDRFAIATREYRQTVCLLLVDSEGPVPQGKGIWTFLAERDGWKRPANADEDHVHLMVQCMEAWLVADPGALERFYDGGFSAAKLPQRQDIEAVPKADLQQALDAATRKTKTKGCYDKGSHSFALLAFIDPQAVRARSPFAARFFDALRRHCAG